MLAIHLTRHWIVIVNLKNCSPTNKLKLLFNLRLKKISDYNRIIWIYKRMQKLQFCSRLFLFDFFLPNAPSNLSYPNLFVILFNVNNSLFFHPIQFFETTNFLRVTMKEIFHIGTKIFDSRIMLCVKLEFKEDSKCCNWF